MISFVGGVAGVGEGGQEGGRRPEGHEGAARASAEQRRGQGHGEMGNGREERRQAGELCLL